MREKILHRRLAQIALLITGIPLIGCNRESVGMVLTYRVRPDAANRAFQLEDLVKSLDNRLRGAGKAKALSNGHVEVHLYGTPEPAELNSIRFRVETPGYLEFRIVADMRRTKDRPIIDLAYALPPDEKDVRQNGNSVAEWMTYSEGAFGPVDQPDESGVVKRVANNRPEALVLTEPEPLSVTGAYLTSATMGLDERGGPAVHFSFDRRGAQLFRRLTSQNKPSPAMPNRYRHLGIILDKRLLSAPRIITAISDRGMISGSMTEREAEDIVDVLHAGALPHRVEFINERRVAQ